MMRPNPPARYRQTRHPLKAGGYGVVEVWHDNMLDREVAIKWLGKPEAELELINEWQLLAQSLSRYVVQLYDLVLDEKGKLFGIVLEFIDGQALSEVPLPQNEDETNRVLKLLYQFACGLADLHDISIIHRDVKPANAVVGGDGRLKIVDFGISSSEAVVETQEVRGTAQFSSPEHWSKIKPVVLTAKTDVYCFGLVCWAVLSGKLPVVGPAGSPDIHHFPVVSLNTVFAVPGRLGPVIDSCLAWSADDRPSMKEVAAAIRAELIKGQHVATVAVSSGVVEINAADPKKGVRTGVGNLQMIYDGYEFKIAGVEGEVFVNNVDAAVGGILSEGCLIMFGSVGRGRDRAYSPFRQFSPEVVI